MRNIENLLNQQKKGNQLINNNTFLRICDTFFSVPLEDLGRPEVCSLLMHWNWSAVSWFTSPFVKFTCISKLPIVLQRRKIGEQRIVQLIQVCLFVAGSVLRKWMTRSSSGTGRTITRTITSHLFPLFRLREHWSMQREHREPSHPFRIWIKDQTTFIARVLCFVAAILNF